MKAEQIKSLDHHHKVDEGYLDESKLSKFQESLLKEENENIILLKSSK